MSEGNLILVAVAVQAKTIAAFPYPRFVPWLGMPTAALFQDRCPVLATVIHALVIFRLFYIVLLCFADHVKMSSGSEYDGQGFPVYRQTFHFLKILSGFLHVISCNSK